MKLLSCTAENFGSYHFVGLDFADMGLTLAQGATGSGKSTLPDIACWGLFGVTAKGGSVDMVRSWTAGDVPTRVQVSVDVNGPITITRIRGKSSQNDLYWTEEGQDDEKRGKDLTETQKLLNQRLGVDADLYLSSAYFSEFSPTANFFLSKPKDRREVFERIASLDLPVKLGLKAAESRKTVKATLSGLQNDKASCEGKLDGWKASMSDATQRAKGWEAVHVANLLSLEAKRDSFDADSFAKIVFLQEKSEEFESLKTEHLEALATKMMELDAENPRTVEAVTARMEAVSAALSECYDRCDSCGAPKESKDRQRLQAELETLREEKMEIKLAAGRLDDLARRYERKEAEANPYPAQIEAEKARENHYAAQLEKEKTAVNPFKPLIAKSQVQAAECQEYLYAVNKKLLDADRTLSGLNRLYDLSFDLRGALLKQAVKDIESATNTYLEKYFDSELKVTFSIDKADSLDVAIQKSGHECAYPQLSKGQRGLLKLSFMVSVMAASANKAGTHFDNLFFDEALDGLDSDLKVKAFQLFEELSASRSSILVIDHSPELQQMFANKIHVTLNGDASEIELDHE